MVSVVPRLAAVMVVASLAPLANAAPSAWRPVDFSTPASRLSDPGPTARPEAAPLSPVDLSFLPGEVDYAPLAPADGAAAYPLVPLPPALWSAGLLGLTVAGRRVIRRFV